MKRIWTKRIFVFITLLFVFPSLGFAESPPGTIASSPEEIKPLEVGKKVPPLKLNNGDGLQIDLNKILKNQPSIIIFYRGGWCVYCNKHFGQLKSIEEPLQKLGYQLIAISPDKEEKIQESLRKHNLNYMLLSDSDAKAMLAFGLAYRLDNATHQLYKTRFNIDIEEDSGKTHHLLPVPAAFVIDKKGVIRWSYTNTDYKIRVDPQELLDAARKALVPSVRKAGL